MREDRTPFLFPPISPLADNSNRPFWSVMIPIYNRVAYLERVLQSILVQEVSPKQMQIEVVDNSSEPIGIQKIVQKIGQGRIDYYKQPHTISMSANWNTCIQRARGHWVHILHDDDLILPGFYQVYRRTIEANNCIMVASQVISIDEEENWVGISERLPTERGAIANQIEIVSSKSILVAPSIVVKRDAYETVGGFSLALQQVADWEMWSRLATIGTICYVKRPYSLYRFHSESMTSENVAAGINIPDSLKALNAIKTRIDDLEMKERVSKSVRRWLWESVYFTGLNFSFQNNYIAAMSQARLLIELNPYKISSYTFVIKLLKSLVISKCRLFVKALRLLKS